MLLVVLLPVEVFQWCAIEGGLTLFRQHIPCSEKTVAVFGAKSKKILQHRFRSNGLTTSTPVR